ncbi:hypothetical protein T281_15500 [Rhodomicrobium udaipurense JA643]|uniref:Uncharacterized protein n=1 Tax=Rhodomicrobium udaipurense TaxID=1202716 RepID=A0A8I1KKF4_9HYPH|nr:hypothetical protein [Rhodomicrobium udaipurense]KAI93629.1 hypothetical protein T281_15500 [Rhodomicrobium udaipurense JA643]MBJ7543999.1 hypothetical protein [Rhodomicrobium udaipurense]
MSYGKSIRGERIEGDFAAYLQEMKPDDDLFEFGASILRDVWDRRVTGIRRKPSPWGTSRRATQRKVEQFLDRIAETDSPALITAYEKRIGELEARKLELSEKIAECGRPRGRFDETFRTSMGFLLNPYKLWVSPHLEHKRTVLKMTFADRLIYVRNEGLRTPELAMSFKSLPDLRGIKSGMAPPRGRAECCAFSSKINNLRATFDGY